MEFKTESCFVIKKAIFNILILFYPFRGNTISEDDHNKSVDSKLQSVDYMSFDRITMTATFLSEGTKYRPKIAIICGSGLGKSIIMFRK